MSVMSVQAESVYDDDSPGSGDDSGSDDAGVSHWKKSIVSSTIEPHPFFPEITFKPRVKVISYPKTEVTTIPASPQDKMLQMSMKYIPLGNINPKVTDAPYLFKVPGKGLPFTKPHKRRVSIKIMEDEPQVQCIPRPSIPPVTPPAEPILSLRCPTAPNSQLKRAHQNLVMTYVDYYNREIDPIPPEVIDNRPKDYTFDPDKEWSLSCSLCCKLPRRPKQYTDSGDTDVSKYAPPPHYVGAVAFFPDFSSLFENGAEVPTNVTAGWMDSNGVFHAAQMGDLMPTDAVIGYLKDGVFYPLMTVKEGVRKGVVGVRMANTDGIGPYPGDPRRAFMSPIVGYQTPAGEIHSLSSAGQFGYVNEYDDFSEHAWYDAIPQDTIRAIRNQNDGTILLMSRHLSTSKEAEEKIPPTATSGFIDLEGFFVPLTEGTEIPIGGTRAYESDNQVVLISLLEGDDDWWNRLPDKSQGGFIDSHGKFNVLHKGQMPHPGGFAAYSLNGKFFPVRITKHAPPGTVVGYVLNNEFVVLRDGQELPAGGILSFRTENQKVYPLGTVFGYIDQNGRFIELKPGDSMPSGSTPAQRSGSGRVIPELDPKFLQVGSSYGYIDEQGLYHELKEGDELPRGAVLVVRSADGSFVPVGGQGLENATIGYIDPETGEFVAAKGQNIPDGASLSIQYEDGRVVPIEREVTLEDSATLDPLETKISGYVKDGTFYALNENEQIPDGGQAAVMDEAGNVILPQDDVRAGSMTSGDGRAGSTSGGSRSGPTSGGGRVGSTSGDGRVGSTSGDGRVGSTSGDGRVGSTSGDGRVGSTSGGSGSGSTSGGGRVGSTSGGSRSGSMTSEDVVEYLKGTNKVVYMNDAGEILDVVPDPLPSTGLVGFIGSDGTFHSIPNDTEIGYMKDGQFIVLRPSEVAPPGVQVGYRQGSIFHPVNEQPTLGYRDTAGNYHEITAGHEVPENVTILQGVAGYLDRESFQFHVLQPGDAIPEGSMLMYRNVGEEGRGTGGVPQSIPEGGQPAYRGFDGFVKILKEGEAAPFGSIYGYVLNGVFHPMGQVEEAGEDVDLRGTEMTEEERERFEAFKNSLGVQCEMEKVEGSLDLGEVFRKTFRIYSHGASVDIDLKPEPEQTRR